jgi:hypothetical protein
MFFAKEDEGFTKAKNIVKGAFIALAVIGLSWIITRFIFWVA